MIPITLYKLETGKITETAALVNSGAAICCINLYLAQRMKWLLIKIPRPMYAWNADRTNNTGGIIQYKANLSLQINPQDMVQDFCVLDLGGKNNVILGYPWLTRHKPRIDWKEGTLYLTGTPVPRYDKLEVVEQRYLL